MRQLEPSRAASAGCTRANRHVAIARGPARVGGSNCASAIRTRVFRFGEAPGVRQTTVEALDLASHPLTFSIKLPRTAQFVVWMQRASGETIDLFDRARRRGCKARGSEETCVIRNGLVEGKSLGSGRYSFASCREARLASACRSRSVHSHSDRDEVSEEGSSNRLRRTHVHRGTGAAAARGPLARNRISP